MPTWQDNDFSLIAAAAFGQKLKFNCSSITTTAEVIIPPFLTSDTMACLGLNQVFTGDQTCVGSTAFRVLTGNTGGALEIRTPGSGSDSILLMGVTTNARTWTLPDDTGTLPSIVAPSSATVNKTAQTASIGATTTYTTVHAGLYRMSAYAVFTAVTTPGNLTINAIYTDPQQAQTVSFNRNNTLAYAAAGSHVEGELTFYSTTASLIRFSTTLTGIGTYSLYVRVESLT